jgi:hypothetical protein
LYQTGNKQEFTRPMARPQRIELADASYHVSNSRKTGKPLFSSKSQVDLFMDQVLAAGRRFNVEVHGWALHKRAYQLVVKTPEANLSRFMRQVDGLYTLRCQQQGWRGPVFGSRYKSVLLQEENVAGVLHYLHHEAANNGGQELGARASSIAVYLGRQQWEMPVVTGGLGRTPGKRKQALQQQLATSPPATVQHFFARKSRPSVWGDASFVRRIRKTRPSSARVANHARPSVDRIVDCVASQFAVTPASILQAARGPGSKNIPRWVAMHLCQELGAITLQVIATRFGLQRYGTVSTTIGKLKAELPANASLQRALAKVSRQLG